MLSVLRTSAHAADNLSRSLALCKKSLGAGLFISALLWGNPCTASQTEALLAIEKQEWTRAFAAVQAEGDPLLEDIYFWRRFQADDGQGTFESISHFIDSHPRWPNKRALRLHVEERLSGQEDPAALVRWFDKKPPLSAEGLDAYAKALLRLNKRPQFKAMINDWWATTLMARPEQKYIYRRYGTNISLESHRKRFDKLLFNRQYSNARAIAQVLGKGYPALTEARIALAENKAGVDRLVAAVPQDLQRDPGLLYERLKWRRKKNMDSRAIEILNNPPPFESISNPQDWWQERHIIIRRLLERKDYKTAYSLASHHIQREGFAYAQAQWLAGWLALNYMHKPAEAFDRFQQLEANVSTPVSLARAQYWAGRAGEALAQPVLAQIWYKKAARYQTVYYGQKAGDHVAAQAVLANMRSPVIDSKTRSAFGKDPLVRAARLYHDAGFEDVSGDFLWAFALQEGSAEGYMYAIETAARLQQSKDVVALAKHASRKGLFITQQSYPLRLKDMSAAHNDVEWALLHALMRQESQFNPKAKSPVGALGLMQLMPSTAKLVAKQQGIKHYTSWLTDRPHHNIRLGASYIHQLIDQYDGAYELAIAAYNAGPSRVNKWLKQFGDPRTDQIEMMDWIELIPIYETRNYVQRVMEGLYVYRTLLDKKQPRVNAVASR